jgi:hypothetical protein
MRLKFPTTPTTDEQCARGTDASYYSQDGGYRPQRLEVGRGLDPW